VVLVSIRMPSLKVMSAPQYSGPTGRAACRVELDPPLWIFWLVPGYWAAFDTQR